MLKDAAPKTDQFFQIVVARQGIVLALSPPAMEPTEPVEPVCRPFTVVVRPTRFQDCDRIRYCQPHPTDTSRARCPNAPIWDVAQAEMQGDLNEMRAA